MVRRSPALNVLASGLLAALIITSAGCMGFSNSSDLSAGELEIDNQDNQSHEVVIQDVGNGEISQSVAANSRQTVTLVESAGNYTINATIDGMTRVNTTLQLSPGGENGDELAGPGLILTIRSDGEASFSQSMD